MVFNQSKAQYSYQIFTTDNDYFNDVDGVKQIACNDGCYRWVAFEIKHPRENMENIYNQIYTQRHILNPEIPIVVAEIAPEDVEFVDGKITDTYGAEIGATRTAWVNLNTCVIKYMVDFPVGTSSMFEGLRVDDLLEAIRKGTNDMDKVCSKSKVKWRNGLKYSNLCERF